MGATCFRNNNNNNRYNSKYSSYSDKLKSVSPLLNPLIYFLLVVGLSLFFPTIKTHDETIKITGSTKLSITRQGMGGYAIPT